MAWVFQVMAASEAPPQDAEPANGEPGMAVENPEEHILTAPGLTEAQLMEVFKQTSIFNVRSALANNNALMSAREIDEANDR
jgi:hypothetical protein